jgi:hypothetical protein
VVPIVIGGAFLLLVSILATSTCSDPHLEAEKKAESERDAARDAWYEDFYATMERTGFIQKTEAPNTAYVESAMWQMANVDVKTNAVRAISLHFKKLGTGEHAYVFDYQTGKQVAEYGAWGGVEIK